MWFMHEVLEIIKATDGHNDLKPRRAVLGLTIWLRCFFPIACMTLRLCPEALPPSLVMEPPGFSNF